MLIENWKCIRSEWIDRVKMSRPLVYYLMDKDTRSRIQHHNVPENPLPDILSSYGILQE